MKKPKTPDQVDERATIIKAVLAGQMTISQAAERLGIARVNMQALVHRAEAALIDALLPRASGPSPRPAKQVALESEVDALRAKNAKLERELQTMDGLLGAAGDIIRSLRGMPPRRPSSRGSSQSSTPPSTSKDEPEDPDPARALLARVMTMPEHGQRAARALGVSADALTRWLTRLAHGEPVWRQRGARPKPVSAVAEAQVRWHVRELHGLVGADSLAHSVEGVSRRSAARIKQTELSAMERERQEAAGRVEVLSPGVMRGLDAMYLATDAGRRFALPVADACVAYRTVVPATEHYDEAAVLATLERDIAEHGAPLVYRMDRARCQRTPAVLSLLEAHCVLLLEGPPHHPGYYGQLERQNREHRAWLEHLGVLAAAELDATLEQMRSALNRIWRRRTLGWSTAEEAWRARPMHRIDRIALREEVADHAGKLQAGGVREDLAMRLAIEQALTKRGLLRVTPRRRALCG